MEQNKSIYINVGDNLQWARKDVLNLNIDIINLLKKYEYIKEIRHNKLKGFNILKDLMKEINEDFSKLRNELPELDHKKEGKALEKEGKYEIKKQVENRELTALEKEMNKLKLKLRQIE